MRRHRHEKNKIIIFIFLMLIIATSIGYAILTERLTINNTVSYDAMKWDVGFTEADDGIDDVISTFADFILIEYGSLEELGFSSREELEDFVRKEFFSGDEIYANSTATISKDKKTITANCELKVTTTSQYCAVRAVITNDSTFNVAFSENPVVTYDSSYIGNSEVYWLNHDVYGASTKLFKGQTIEVGESVEIVLSLSTNILTEDMLPSSELTIPITLEVNFEEVDYSISDLAMVVPHQDEKAFWMYTYRENIKNITFENKINVPDNAIESWDISLTKDGRVMSYIVPNENDPTYYDLYIQSNDQLYANFDMSYWFANFDNVDSINGLELLDTRYTLIMSSMFSCTGKNSKTFTLDVSQLDTSNVTNMSAMFVRTGQNSSEFLLDVSNFDTSNVTDMHEMFWNVGYNSSVFTLDLSNFDTSNVTDMALMFFNAGYNSTEFDLDLEGFDTSKVENMQWMLWNAGYNSTKFVTDITIKNPNVRLYDHMFDGVATKTGSKITVNYTSETSDLVDQMIATKSDNSNVVKGVQVD